MAHYVMHTQIKAQTAAFIKGFKYVINPGLTKLGFEF